MHRNYGGIQKTAQWSVTRDNLPPGQDLPGRREDSECTAIGSVLSPNLYFYTQEGMS